MTEQLDTALADLATKLGTTVEQLGPETVKAYGGSLAAQVHIYGTVAVWSAVAFVAFGILSLIFGEDQPIWIAMVIVSVFVGMIALLFYNDAAILLAAYTASPTGATALHLVGK